MVMGDDSRKRVDYTYYFHHLYQGIYPDRTLSLYIDCRLWYTQRNVQVLAYVHVDSRHSTISVLSSLPFPEPLLDLEYTAKLGKVALHLGFT